MPCRDFLSQLRESYDEVESAGAGAVAVATGAPFQARALMDGGVRFPCLLDPDKELYRALGIRRIRWWRWFDPRTWTKYLSSATRARQGMLTGDVLQAPGVLVLDADGVIRYLYRGRTLGDYPPLRDVLDALHAIA